MLLPPDPTPDDELLKRFAAGRCEDAFAELVRRHGPRVRRLCRHLAANHADDAFQATFLVLAKNAGRVRTAAVGSYLVGVAGRVAKRVRAREHRFRTVPLVDLAAVEAQTDFELARILAEELAALPAALRGPVVLCWLDGHTHAAAANILTQSERTLRRRLDRAKRVLHARLTGRGVAAAAAAGFFTGLGTAEGTVPEETVLATTEAVYTFLAGGLNAPAVALATGVRSMTLRTATAAVVLVAGIATAVGVGFADDKARPPAASPPAAPAPQAITPPVTAVTVEAPKPVRAPAVPAVTFPHDVPETDKDRLRTFAGTPTEARALYWETEFLEKQLTKKWLGAEKQLPKLRVVATGRYDPAIARVSPVFVGGKLTQVEIRPQERELGRLLESELPALITRAVIVSHLGRPIPDWVDRGVSLELYGTPQDRNLLVQKCGGHLKSGLAMRLTGLFDQKRSEYPSGSPDGFDNQSYAVTAFLMDRKPKDRYASFLKFVDVGTADGWTKAARTEYGFSSLFEMQDEWLQWMHTQAPGFGPKPSLRPGLIAPGEIPPKR